MCISYLWCVYIYIILLLYYIYIPASPKVKLNEVFRHRPSFTRIFGLPRFDRAQPFFPSRSSSPSFFHIGRHCTPIFLWYQSHKWRPKTISVQPWIWLEPHLKLLMHHWKAPCFQSPSDHSPSWLMGLSNLQWKATRTDIPELCKANSRRFPSGNVLIFPHLPGEGC